jgi:UDP-galactopyranose mutase
LKYEKESKLIKNTFFVGRLAEFKYYNMDQAAASALKISGSILKLLDKE